MRGKEKGKQKKKIGSSFIMVVRSQDINLESKTEMLGTLQWIIHAAEMLAGPLMRAHVLSSSSIFPLC